MAPPLHSIGHEVIHTSIIISERYVEMTLLNDGEAGTYNVTAEEMGGDSAPLPLSQRPSGSVGVYMNVIKLARDHWVRVHPACICDNLSARFLMMPNAEE